MGEFKPYLLTAVLFEEVVPFHDYSDCGTMRNSSIQSLRAQSVVLPWPLTLARGTGINPDLKSGSKFNEKPSNKTLEFFLSVLMVWGIAPVLVFVFSVLQS